MKTKTKIVQALLVFCCIATSVISMAQDTIYKVDGTNVIAKITELKDKEISYFHYSYQDGPLYVEKKADVTMIAFANGLKEYFDKPKQEVNATALQPNQAALLYYQPQVKVPARRQFGSMNGKIEVYGRSERNFAYNGYLMGERDLRTMLLSTNDPQIAAHIKKAKEYQGYQYVGFLAIPMGIIALACASSTDASNGDAMNTVAVGCFMVGISCPIASGIFRSRRTEENKEAVRLFNQKY